MQTGYLIIMNGKMIEAIYSFFTQFPDWLATMLLAMLPIIELRGSIPFAIGVFEMAPWLAFLLSIIGDIIPAIFIVWFIGPLSKFLSKHFNFFKKLFDWWFRKVLKNFEGKYSKYGVWALMIFVAIPLPITGAWTGAVASFLFEVPKKKALLFIGLGVIIAGVIVTLISTGAFAVIR